VVDVSHREENIVASPNTDKRGQWMALTAALLGWMFDGAEMGVFSMVGRSAIRDLLGYQGTNADQEAQIGFVFGVIIAVFLVGAAAGGVLFGWLGDRIGRVRAMSLSILVYSLFTGLCGFAQDPIQLGALRFIASMGMGGEWSLGVALVMEVWPNKSRALMAGLIGAAANAGYLLVGVISIGLGQHSNWRLMMMLGAFPALLTFFFRIFVPESKKWEHGKQQGHASGWRTEDLFGVVLGCLGPALIIYVWTPGHQTWERIAGTPFGLLVATVGFSYPVIRYLQRQLASDGAESMTHDVRTILGRMYLGACLSGVALLGTWGTTQWAMSWAGKLSEKVVVENPDFLQRYPTQCTQIAVAIGAMIGTLLAAWLGEKLGRRVTYVLMCLASIISVLWLYQMHNEYNLSLLIAALIAGICTASFYGWLPLYLPELFPTRVRATCQGFGFNFGRILAAIGTLQMGVILADLNGIKTFAGEVGGYPVACSLLTGVYLIGIVLIWFAPETKGKPLPA